VGNWVGCFPARCLQVTESFGAPGLIRTGDLLLRRQTLYPAELRVRVFNAPEIHDFLHKHESTKTQSQTAALYSSDSIQ
jgi:hypothetical protein